MTLNEELLPPPERIKILKERLKNLRNGSGDFDGRRRTRAIKNSELALRSEQEELRGMV